MHRLNRRALAVLALVALLPVPTVAADVQFHACAAVGDGVQRCRRDDDDGRAMPLDPVDHVDDPPVDSVVACLAAGETQHGQRRVRTCSTVRWSGPCVAGAGRRLDRRTCDGDHVDLSRYRDDERDPYLSEPWLPVSQVSVSAGDRIEMGCRVHASWDLGLDCGGRADGSLPGGAASSNRTSVPTETRPYRPDVSTADAGTRPSRPADPTARTPTGVPSPPTAGTGPGTDRLLVALTFALAAWILYRRLSRDEIVGHDLRSRMIDRIEASPGRNASSLADELDVAITTILYHGRILAEADQVTVKRTGGEVQFYGPAGPRDVDPETVACLRSELRQALLGLVADDPGIHVAEAARRLDVSASKARYHVDRLVEEGLIAAETTGRSKRLRVTEDGRASLGRIAT